MIKSITLLSLLLILSSCVNYTQTFRVPCEDCDKDLLKWKEDCIPTCLSVEQEGGVGQARMNEGFELSYVKKEQFNLKKLNDGTTSTSINCLCSFQKLTSSQHNEAVRIFGKTSITKGRPINGIDKRNDTKIETVKYDNTLKFDSNNYGSAVGFFPQRLNSYTITPYDKDYFSKMSRYSEQAWINFTFDYLDDDKTIIHQYIEENQSYWEWTAPPFEGGTSRLWGYIHAKKNVYNGKYVKDGADYGFTVYATQYNSSDTYNKIKERWISGINNGPGNKMKITPYLDDESNLEILDADYQYLIFLPEDNTIIQIDFKLVYGKKPNNLIIIDWIEHDFTNEEKKEILRKYLVWLKNSR